MKRFKILPFLLILCCSGSILAQEGVMSVSPGLSIVSTVEDKASSAPLFEKLGKTTYPVKAPTYTNKTKQKSYQVSVRSTEDLLAFLETSKVGNDILAGLLNEKGQMVDPSILEARAKKELTQTQLERLERLSSDESSLIKEFVRLANNSYLLVYSYNGLSEYDVTDTTFNVILNTYTISRKRGYTANLSVHLLKPDFSELTLNTEFFENGYTYSGVDYSPEELQAKYQFRNDEKVIPWKSLASKSEIISTLLTSNQKTVRKKSLSDSLSGVYAASSQRANAYRHNKAKRKTDLSGPYDSKMAKSSLSQAPKNSDFEDLLPLSAKTLKTAYVTDVVTGKSVSKKDRGIRVNIGKEKDLKVNQRYQIRRNVQDKKTGLEKSKFIGSVLATQHITRNARGRGNLGNTSQFKQIYGFRVQQFDQVIEDRIVGTVHGGFGSTGVILAMDFHLRGKLGRKFYFEYGYDRGGQQPSNLNEEILVGGESMRTVMDVQHLTLGLGREYYFNRFYAGYMIGITAYNATFRESDVRDFLVGEGESFYAWDLSWEVGIKGGVRVTKDIGVSISASILNIEFDDQDIPSGNLLNLDGYNENVYLSVFYTIPKLKKKESDKIFNQ